MSSWRGRTSSTRWTRTCSPRSATPSARSAAIPRCARSCSRGQGKHFTAGLDLEYASSQFAPSRLPGPRRRGAAAPYRMAAGRVQRGRAGARPPVIAAIHGGCIGAGVDLASACDLRVASADAFFQVAEVDVAITADLGTLQRLGYLIPQGVLRELTYTGRRMGAEEAARYGLVNRSRPTATPRSPPGWSWPGPSPPSRRSRSPAPRRASTTAAAARSRRACATSPCGTPATLVSADLDRGDPRAARQDRAELRPARRLNPRLSFDPKRG